MPDFLRRACALFLVVVFYATGLQAVSAADSPPEFAKGGVQFLKAHCVGCHSGDEPEADLALDVFRDNASMIPQRKKWEAVLRMLEGGLMPPPDEKQPSSGDREQFTTLVRSVFDYYDRTAPPDPGRVTMRRLNRTEYANTIRDLVYVDFNPTEGFPADDIGHGFDNIGDVLTLSPLLMERYLDAAETIADRAILVDPPAPSKRYLAGRYLQPNNAQTSQARFRVLDPTAPEAVHSGPFTASGSYLKFSADADLIFRATLYAETSSQSPVKVALFINGSGVEDVSSDEELSQLMGANAPKLKQTKILGTFEITARDAKNLQQLEFPINHRGGIQNAGIAVIKPPEGEEPPKLFIQHLWTEGPLETRPSSQLKILVCSADKSPAEQMREILDRFASRAYRRPVTKLELDRLTQLAESIQADGGKLEEAVKFALQAVLCSPKFLFRVELDENPAGKDVRPLDDYQLASRLSYFLWNSMPDDELFELAGRKQLRDNLESQVRRMLADPKAESLVDNFALQWLQLKRLESSSPDATLFPSFNEPLRKAMLQETRLFIAEILREDRSVLDLLDSDFTYLNQPLAQHYGISDTEGNPAKGAAWQPLIAKTDKDGKPIKPVRGKPIRGASFVRVNLQHGLRGGLLTQAGVLTVTSNPTRTSPVKRGKWVLEQLLGTPPPPPPANVPELEAEGRKLTGSLREQMVQHRENPACAACHASMDPLGFAFENFDAVGRWRAKDGDHDIDSSGELPGGETFSGAGELRKILLNRREPFARCLTDKLLTYALGRGLEYYDRPAVHRVVEALTKDDYRFSRLIIEIAGSEPFVNRRGK